ncbi:MAG: hypothetical protein ABIG68_09810 [Acidobacteriota bacterium]
MDIDERLLGITNAAHDISMDAHTLHQKGVLTYSEWERLWKIGTEIDGVVRAANKRLAIEKTA